MVRRRTARVPSAAERRIRALVPTASSLPDAVRHVASELLRGVECPPTNLVELGKRIGVHEILYERLPGSGELHRVKHGYRIVCSSDETPARQRFTVAHEFGHVILERTGRNPPRKGPTVERVCDMLATELLMPTAVFQRLLPGTTDHFRNHESGEIIPDIQEIDRHSVRRAAPCLCFFCYRKPRGMGIWRNSTWRGRVLDRSSTR